MRPSAGLIQLCECDPHSHPPAIDVHLRICGRTPQRVRLRASAGDRRVPWNILRADRDLEWQHRRAHLFVPRPQRTQQVTAEGPPELLGSADRSFHGDREPRNPEQLLLASLAQCPMSSYLHVCVEAGVVVTQYVDRPTGH